VSEPLLAKWLDDRLSLTGAEALELETVLARDPDLARRVKDQLATDELLSRRLAVDRGSFNRQVAQRLANGATGSSFLQSTLDAVERTQRRRPTWRAWAPEAAVAAVLLVGLMGLLLRNDRTPTVEAPAAARPTGLRGQYFSNSTLSGPAQTRMDPAIDFTWRSGAGPLPGGRDIYSARWTGKLSPLYSERYCFRTMNDDGVRVWIDGRLVIDDWKGRPVVVENRGEIQLEAGRRYDLKIEYFNGGDLGVLRLFWSSPSQKEEIVPSRQLSPQ
jgi:hypothetical protein